VLKFFKDVVVRKFDIKVSLVGATVLAALTFANVSWAEDSVILAAGDIAHCGSAGPGKTAEIISQIPGTVLALGDLAYDDGSIQQFRDCYDPTWGKFKDRTRPVPGNHEYHTDGAGGYFSYWGEQAGAKGKGYYSFALKQWHVIALNSNLKGSDMRMQNDWLKDDLKNSKQRCILAFWHHPLFSSSRHGNNSRMRDIADALFARGASVVLAGHDHVYERFDPQSPSGKRDRKRGIRFFTVGTGGAPLYPFRSPHLYSRIRYNDQQGVLKLIMHPTSYKWEFINVEGKIKDRGSADCV